MKLIPNTTIKQKTVRDFENPSFEVVMDQQLGRRPKFGISMYNPKAYVKDRIPIETHMVGKEKRVFFCTQSHMDKAWVEGSPKYHHDYDWN